MCVVRRYTKFFSDSTKQKRRASPVEKISSDDY